MTRDVACCTPDTTIQEAAQMMADCDCGIVPVVEDLNTNRLMGVVTDRDIACRAVAKGMGPDTQASQCMTASPATVHAEDSLEEVERIMSDLQVRRVPVVDDRGCCVGMVSQADVALAAPGHVVNVLTQVSKPEKRAA
jgi:CBS domain-containing protein